MANTTGTGDRFSRDCNHGYQCHQLFTGDLKNKKRKENLFFFLLHLVDHKPLLPQLMFSYVVVVVDYDTISVSPNIHSAEDDCALMGSSG